MKTTRWMRPRTRSTRAKAPSLGGGGRGGSSLWLSKEDTQRGARRGQKQWPKLSCRPCNTAEDGHLVRRRGREHTGAHELQKPRGRWCPPPCALRPMPGARSRAEAFPSRWRDRAPLCLLAWCRCLDGVVGSHPTTKHLFWNEPPESVRVTLTRHTSHVTVTSDTGVDTRTVRQ